MDNKLYLNLEKDNLFNKMILAPHSELNNDIYVAVERFLRKNPVGDFKLSIYISELGEFMKEKFKELYKEHYKDEYRVIRREMFHNNVRGAILVAIAFGLIYLWFVLSHIYSNNVGLVVLGNMGVFFLWEIGSNYFVRLSLKQNLRLYKSALNADIDFVNYKNKKG